MNVWGAFLVAACKKQELIYKFLSSHVVAQGQ